MESRYCFKLFIKFELKTKLTSAFSGSVYAAFTPNRPKGTKYSFIKRCRCHFSCRQFGVTVFCCELQFSVVLKHTRPVVHQDNIRFQAYIQNKSL